MDPSPSPILASLTLHVSLRLCNLEYLTLEVLPSIHSSLKSKNKTQPGNSPFMQKKKKKNLSVASSGFSRFLRWAIRPLRVDLICSFCLCAPHVFQSESCSLECARLFLFWKLHPSFPCPLATAGEYKLKAEFPYLGINVPKTSSYPFLHSLFQSWGWENGVID